ncbi:hypothetical protein C1I60_14260 [Paenibacillus terrae]|uniref:Terminase small subunit n=1 Tax=Paenibacillus terrae TaxID=159743 RepID=A0A4U2PUR3_9BACL|nr:hypothetical protein [Paenibacillus terrae]TKH43452.1 hypothetical protein C1I60_14260 [Paenibacillus terrae]
MAKVKTEAIKVHDQIIQTGELAAIVGKSDRWIRQLTAEKVLQQCSRGKYNLGESVQSYLEHVSGGKEEDKRPRLIDYKTEHEKTKAEKAALELELLKGNLHATGDVEKLLADLIITTKSRLLGIPHRVATECENETADIIESVVRREVESALAGLARYSPDQIGGGTDDS